MENEISAKHEDLLELIFESEFFEEKFKLFYKENLDAIKFLVPLEDKDKLEYLNTVQTVHIAELIGVLSESTNLPQLCLDWI